MKVKISIPSEHLFRNMYFGLINEHIYEVESEYTNEIFVLYNENNTITYVEKKWCTPTKEIDVSLPEDIF